MNFFTDQKGDFGDFRDYRWSDIDGLPVLPVVLDAAIYRVDVQFVVNLCAISFPLYPTLIVPFDTSAYFAHNVAAAAAASNGSGQPPPGRRQLQLVQVYWIHIIEMPFASIDQ